MLRPTSTCLGAPKESPRLYRREAESRKTQWQENGAKIPKTLNKDFSIHSIDPLADTACNKKLPTSNLKGEIFQCICMVS